MGKRIALALCLCFLVNMITDMTVQAGEVSEGVIDYSPVFNAEYYYQAYPDLQDAVGNDAQKLLQHFISSGMKEGRSGNAEFNVRDYMANNIDLIAVYGVKDFSAYYRHYIQSGKAEGRIAVSKNGISDENILASFSTNYNTEEDRAVNVELAAERLNGTVIQPGERFSFSNAILSRTVENGYVMAPSFAGGRVVKSIGGGICQVSSTLYVTMLLSALPVTEHHSHSLLVDYVPSGLDAAIVEGVKDLRFKNSYDYPVRINSTVQNGTLTVSISKA